MRMSEGKCYVIQYALPFPINSVMTSRSLIEWSFQHGMVMEASVESAKAPLPIEVK